MNRLKYIAHRFPNFSKKSIAIALSVLMGSSVVPSLGVKAAGGADQSVKSDACQSGETQQLTKEQLLRELPQLFYDFEFVRLTVLVAENVPTSIRDQIQDALRSASSVVESIRKAAKKAEVEARFQNTNLIRAQACLTAMYRTLSVAAPDKACGEIFDEVRAAYGRAVHNISNYILLDDGTDIDNAAYEANLSTYLYVRSLAQTCVSDFARNGCLSKRLPSAEVYSNCYAHSWAKGESGILYNLIKDAPEDSIIKLKDNLIKETRKLNEVLDLINQSRQ